ncbi:glycosyltransferase family 2 protein [Pseudoalteromonas sp. NZS11_1]|uniref:glycosyltransferase family 2 protein n=1 Tax=Pseudoalteromonas sp. NZS11_1 TaxID=2792070 RepID=UPI0018CFC248|nr:glycosyltransferase family 2 protein [Pseudoalteromonas sp. NZS11_1]MBH0044857.1 glycosyltransferase family 2 protein [Pseudoalteromonas sp. NZS11_1]
MGNHKFYGIVVTFEPTVEHFENIKMMASELSHLIIVDNSEGLKGFECLDSLNNISVLSNKNKNGIAGALNLGIVDLLEKNGGFVFLFDQDSSLPDGFVANQSKFIIDNNECCVAPRYYDVNSKTYGNYTILSKFTIKNIMGEFLSKPTYTTFAITSGTLYSLDVFKKVGLMDESFFIDHVDSEFCIRMKHHNFKILINPEVVFNHSIGARQLRTFLGVKFKPNNHNPTRRYYAVRNGIFMINLWGRDFPALVWLLFLRNVYEFLGVLLFESNRKEKLKALFLGVYDGVVSKKGKCSRAFKQ